MVETPGADPYPGRVEFGINGYELLVLILVVLVVAGPEKLPEFAAQLARLTREFKRIATGARERVREELGPEFDDMDLSVFDPRQYDPRRIVRDALLEDEPSAPRPRPRADRRGVTAPRPPARPAVGAQAATPPPTPDGNGQALPTAPAQPHVQAPSAAESMPVAAAVAEESDAPAPLSAATTPQVRPHATPGSRTGSTAAPGGGGVATAPEQRIDGRPVAAPLSPREIVARTRGLRPAAESPAVVAALAPLGISAAQAAASLDDGALDAPATRVMTPAPVPAAAPQDLPSAAPRDVQPDAAPQFVAPPAGTADAGAEDGYVVPFDDEAT